MKTPIQSYFTFSKSDRWGALALVFIIVLVFSSRIVIDKYYSSYGVVADKKLQDSLLKVYNNSFGVKYYQQAEAAKKYQDYDIDAEPLPDKININTADSALLVRLKGIGPATVSKILIYRKMHAFKSVDELLDIRKIPEETFVELRKHLVVVDSERN